MSLSVGPDDLSFIRRPERSRGAFSPQPERLRVETRSLRCASLRSAPVETTGLSRDHYPLGRRLRGFRPARANLRQYLLDQQPRLGQNLLAGTDRPQDEFVDAAGHVLADAVEDGVRVADGE